MAVAGIEPGYAYTAREWDPEIGLYYYRARYYDPKVGRFISEDPAETLGPSRPEAVDHLTLLSTARALVPDAHAPAALAGSHAGASRLSNEVASQYAYVDNEPIHKIDPHGKHGVIVDWFHWLHNLHLVECMVEKGRCNKKVVDGCKCKTIWKDVCEFNGFDCCNSGFLHCMTFGLLGHPCEI